MTRAIEKFEFIAKNAATIETSDSIAWDINLDYKL